MDHYPWLRLSFIFKLFSIIRISATVLFRTYRNPQQSDDQKFTMSILNIHAREIVDSHEIPLLRLISTTQRSLLSSGIYETLELCVNNKMPYSGKGVSGSVEHINKTIAPTLVSKKLNVMDREMTN